MAFNFCYQMYLVVTHPRMDASRICEALSEFSPDTSISAGEPRRIRPDFVRAASVTVWSARVHEPKYLNTQSAPIDDVLRLAISKLNGKKLLFREITQSNGEVRMQVNWFTTSHSVGQFSPASLQMLGDLEVKLDIEVFTYQPRDTVNA